MKKAVKMRIIQMLVTMMEANKEMEKYLQNKEYDKLRIILADCQECALTVGETIEKSEDNQEWIIRKLEEYCENLFYIYNEMEIVPIEKINEILNKLDEDIKEVHKAVKEYIKTSFKIAFLPYKASMWTSLESIWRAAVEDEECDVSVVVIPYYTLDHIGNKKEFVYEASLFPEYVPITHYGQYSLEKEHPDMIFIHNPYDDRNNVTRVPEQYYSYNLKKYTGQLIYSPYGLMGYYNPEKGSTFCLTNGVKVADKVIVQSEKVKEIYMDHGVASDKLISLGSPKIDAVVCDLKKPTIYPDGWEEKLKGKKVFLLNTHLSYFIKGYIYAMNGTDRYDYAKVYHKDVFDILLNRQDCALIWRPHPLLKATLESRCLYDSLAFVEELEQRIKDSYNAVLDTNGKYDISFRISDALITTYSSVIPEYMISGKPIYVYESRLNTLNCKNSPVDYTNLYYKAKKGEEHKFPKFIQMVLDGKDDLYEQRMADVHKAFSNLEGTIGKNIYQKLKNEWKTY